MSALPVEPNEDAEIGRIIRAVIEAHPSEPMVTLTLTRHSNDGDVRYSVGGSIGRWPDATVIDSARSSESLADALEGWDR